MQPGVAHAPSGQLARVRVVDLDLRARLLVVDRGAVLLVAEVEVLVRELEGVAAVAQARGLTGDAAADAERGDERLVSGESGALGRARGVVAAAAAVDTAC